MLLLARLRQAPVEVVMLNDEPKFLENMTLLCNIGGIPSDDPNEVASVLQYHLEQMHRMNKDSIEFKMSLETAKVLDRQVQELKQRRACPEDCLWVSKIS